MNDIMDTVSYDQYNNIPSLDDLGAKSKVIFSEEAYKKCMEMFMKTNRENAETGCFFVGRKAENENFTIYIDSYTSEFVCEDGIYSNGGASPTTQNYNELNSIIKKYKRESNTPCVFHFHTHPRFGYYESYSDQDLHIYAKMASDNKDCECYGMLGFPMKNSFGISVVTPINPIDNLKIEDINVGYIDVNKRICIPTENLTLDFEEKEIKER